MKTPQIDKCSWCGGHGLCYTGGEYGDIDDCTHCQGAGWEEARDDRGRFLPWVETPVYVDDGSKVCP